MKRTFTLITLLFIVVNVTAQKKIIFNTNYLPNTNYTVSTVMNMNMEMDFKGDTAQIRSMKNSGMKMPMIMLMNYDMQLGVKAGKKDAKNEYPVLMTYNKMAIKGTMNDKEIPIPNQFEGSKIYAKYDAAGNITIDSLPGKALDDATRQTLMNSVTELQRQFKFPATGIAVGETFKKDIPMSLPVAGKNMEMLINTTFKLTKVANDVAYFDVEQSATADMPVNNGAAMKMTGAGQGKMEYSLKSKFINTYNSNFNFGYSVNVNNVIMEGKADMKCLYSVKVN